VIAMYGGRYDAGQRWAEGDLCPLAEDDRCTGRLREQECPLCGGDWQDVAVEGGFMHLGPCRRCDMGSVFVCDTCGCEP